MSPGAATWLGWRCEALDAATNMAWDDVLLSTSPARGLPVFRSYEWSEPAASFGYFQKISEIEQATLLRPLVRRPTGGGLVPHAADWTYSVAVPPGHEWYALRAEASYQRMHEWIQRAFARLGLVTELATCCRKELPGQCFAGYEKHDVLLHGRKLAGAAQRRTKQGLLIQGSIQPPPAGLARATWVDAMREMLGGQWGEFQTAPELESQMETVRAEKYASPSYNQRR